MPPKLVPRLVIDMRCLQDRNYFERGIGNHARCLVMHAPEPFIGLIDPKLPPLPEDLAALPAWASPHAYLPGLAEGAVFLNPSPMSPDQNFVARLVLDGRILKAACVHDFIPYDAPEIYLTHPVNRLDYFASMAWLRRYDVFLPNSEPTKARLLELVRDVRAEVSGVALPAWLAGVQPGAGRHILMVGGDDARKNPEVLARAHAGSAVLKDVPLVISGTCTAETAARLRAITTVELPGRVSDAGMQALYEQAICVVVPSRAEGFSLPVIEASAAGVPVVVSDIAAHRALVGDVLLRFAPDDAAGLAGILEGLLVPGRRAEVAAAQAGIWRGFTAEAVAARVFASVRPPARPAVLRGAKARVAMLTPMPPEQSGIADYSAGVAAALGEMVDLTVFSGASVSARAHADRRFDRVVSVVGNSPLHADIYDLAGRWGSAVICHDARLLGLASGRGLAAAAAMAARELGREVTEAEILRWAADERVREACFLGELAGAARPLIFHSGKSAALVRARFGVVAEVLPFAVQRVFGARTAARRAAARRTLGVADGEKLLVSFGFVTRDKGIEAALHAFAALRKTVNCRLVFVGEGGEVSSGFEELARALGVADFVRLGGEFVSEAVYRDYLMAADCGVQLREGGAGNVSGTLQDCVAAGLPSVANMDLAEGVEAPGYVRRVGDGLEVAEIAGALRAALEDGGDFEAERVAYCAAHGMAGYARGLLDVLGVA